MSLFNKVFGSGKQEEKNDAFWTDLESMEELNAIEKESFNKLIAVFKHSTRCGISRMAWNRFQQDYNIPNEQIDLYYLDLLAYRDISNEIANRFGVIHQSPQLIVIKDGKAIYNASHESIDATKLEQLA